MKVLQINVVYNTGSTGKIMCDIRTVLEEVGIESVICYGRGPSVQEPNVYKTCPELYSKMNNLASRLTGLMYGGCLFSTSRLLGIIRKENPDVVHLHCLNGYFVNIYRLVAWLNRHRIKTVLTLHAEFIHTANCAYAFECEKWKTGCGNCPRREQETKSIFLDGTHRSWRKMKKAFEGFENLTVVSVSPWLMDRAKQSPILQDFEHVTVLNGLDTETFCPTASNIREALGVGDRKMIFHATPKFDDDPQNIKGGVYLIKLAERMSDACFVVAGSYPEGLSVPDNMILLGKVGDQKLLAQYYSVADLTVLTSRRETFSMIVAESLSCGTPVVGFLAGGPEGIALAEYSRFVAYGDVDALYDAMVEMLSRENDRNAVAAAAAQAYAKRGMAEKYMEIYRK